MGLSQKCRFYRAACAPFNRTVAISALLTLFCAQLSAAE